MGSVLHNVSRPRGDPDPRCGFPAAQGGALPWADSARSRAFPGSSSACTARPSISSAGWTVFLLEFQRQQGLCRARGRPRTLQLWSPRLLLLIRPGSSKCVKASPVLYFAGTVGGVLPSLSLCRSPWSVGLHFGMCPLAVSAAVVVGCVCCWMHPPGPLQTSPALQGSGTHSQAFSGRPQEALLPQGLLHAAPGYLQPRRRRPREPAHPALPASLPGRPSDNCATRDPHRHLPVDAPSCTTNLSAALTFLHPPGVFCVSYLSYMRGFSEMCTGSCVCSPERPG